MRRDRPDAGAVPRRPRRRWVAVLLLSILLVSAVATPALSDEYDSSMAGHPLRIVAYVLHPVGVVIDYLILRPAHWLVGLEPMQTIFGHET